MGARLAIWTAFPITITDCADSTPLVVLADADGIMAALEYKDCVCCIDLKRIPSSLFASDDEGPVPSSLPSFKSEGAGPSRYAPR